MAIVSWRDNAADSWFNHVTLLSARASFLSLCHMDIRRSIIPGGEQESETDGHKIKPSEFCGCLRTPPYNPHAMPSNCIRILGERNLDIWNGRKCRKIWNCFPSYRVTSRQGLQTRVAQFGTERNSESLNISRKRRCCAEPTNGTHFGKQWKWLGSCSVRSLVESYPLSSSSHQVEHRTRKNNTKEWARPSLRSVVLVGVSLSSWDWDL